MKLGAKIHSEVAHPGLFDFNHIALALDAGGNALVAGPVKGSLKGNSPTGQKNCFMSKMC